MSETVAVPENLDALQTLLASESVVLPVGNQTKLPLAVDEHARLVSLRELNGILEYEPSEFTFTAYAGTPVAEVSEVLRERQQYLPFDPMLVKAGATMGGSVAAGLSGPGRFRYGGLRDFLLGIKFLSGDGEVINAGGKVVKNAAGFDIPKFMAGSLGRFGVMVELTFKVFPLPSHRQTIAVQCSSLANAMQRMSDAATSRWELDAIDYRPGTNTVFLRVAGPLEVNQVLVQEISDLWGQDVKPMPDAEAFWQSVVELDWSDSDLSFAAKIPTHPVVLRSLVPWAEQTAGVDLHVSVAGSVAWALCESQHEVDQLDHLLAENSTAGLVVRGDCRQPKIGFWAKQDIASAVKMAMDPTMKFPQL